MSQDLKITISLHPRGGKHFLVPLDRYNYSIFYENGNFDFHLLIVTMAMHFVLHMLFNPCENSTIVKDPEIDSCVSNKNRMTMFSQNKVHYNCTLHSEVMHKNVYLSKFAVTFDLYI